MRSSAKPLYGRILSKFEDWQNSRLPHPDRLEPNSGSRLLAEKIRSGRPFFSGRLGTTENNNLSWFVRYRKPFGLPFARDLREGSWTAAGLFPPRSVTLDRWCRLCEEALGLCDVYAAWDLAMDGHYRRRELAGASFVDLGTLDAFAVSEPWTLALEGRRVLVVHPFASTIESQYSRRELLFPGRAVLPTMDLVTVRTPQTLAGNNAGFRSWNEAFARTCELIDQQTYDIALVAAGSYGMPLSAHIRKSGRSVIYVGGVLQVFFGIRGGRWDGAGLYNEAWVRPSEEDRPQNFRKVEQGCYW